MGAKAAIKGITPGDWYVLVIPDGVPGAGKFFVAAKPYPGHPHLNHTRNFDIGADENYPTKWADCHAIATVPKLIKALQLAQELLIRATNTPPAGDERWAQIADALDQATNPPAVPPSVGQWDADEDES